MYRILLLLIFISLPLFATNILNYEIQEYETNNIEVVLSLDGKWEGVTEQKNSDEEMIFVFKGLGTKVQKSQNFSNIEYINLSQLDKNESRLTFKSEQTFDAVISNGTNEIRISLIPKTTPLTIESIANGANNRGIIAYILDASFYIAIFSAVLIIAFFIFIKVKLFPHINVQTKNVNIENNALHVEKNNELLDEKQNDSEEINGDKDDDGAELKESKTTKVKKPPTSQKKPKQTKSLFDL
ncbi:MAG: hypothetical protein LBI78_02460 [Campylobacteraceae bacterium]|nr:hypothetical protein [Campylobacteraceae bacterium]